MLPLSKTMDKHYNLERFVIAQEPIFEQACKELLQECKTGHWMWFIFPQIAGLGFSAMSREFAISSLEEARAYLAHPVLGPRLREVCSLVNQIKDKSMHQVFGSPDDLKLKSSLTLFAQATVDNALFMDILKNQFERQFDQRTLVLIDLLPQV